jgi:hypothetical protein
METLERWLRERSLVISLLLALAVIYGLSTNGVVSEEVMPFGDSEYYVLRGMTLYGDLHSGQWSHFWDVFTLPRQSLAPLHYWLFFLLPQGWAGMTSYGVIQVVTTYGLLALGVRALCRALDRAEWSPAVFLLCASQNISLDESYFYFADVPFLALGTVALAWQVRAWRDGTWRNSLLSGAGAGLMFWVKAPNAILFTGTYLLAEIVWIVLTWREMKRDVGDDAAGVFAWRKNRVRHVAAVTAGFIPVTLLALACGGFQSIIKLVDTNEVSGLFTTTLECTGLLRALYFPLCLTFFYHAVAMALIFTAMGLVAWQLNRRAVASSPGPSLSSGARFPAFLLLPLLAAYFTLGEFFSFGMEYKSMRFLLMVLPVFWLAIFWALERGRVRPGLIFMAVAAYAVCGYSQILFNAFGSRYVSAESYQLKDDWLSRLPPWHADGSSGIGMTNRLVTMIRQALPEGGKVAIGTEQIYLTSESLAWASQHDTALHGRPGTYEFDNFLANDGRYCRSSLLHARGILVFVHPSLQYSREVEAASIALIQFCAGSWRKEGLVRMIPLQTSSGELLGCLVVAKEPFTDAQITELIAATHAAELPPDVEFGSVDHRLTWRECWDILMRWKEKRLGEAAH